MHMTSDTLIDALRDQGLRITAARRAVCSIIAERHSEHITAAMILETVQSDPDAKADQSTVYRTLDALETAGLLAHSHLGHGPAIYHLADDAAHQHVVCSNCGKTAAVPASSLPSWLADLQEATGFTVDPSHFAVDGLCPDCTSTAT